MIVIFLYILSPILSSEVVRKKNLLFSRFSM